MKITVNGETKEINSNQIEPTLSYVIKQLIQNPRLVVVEFNGVILPPTIWNEQKVNEGDILEIVTIVGGGS